MYSQRLSVKLADLHKEPHGKLQHLALDDLSVLHLASCFIMLAHLAKSWLSRGLGNPHTRTIGQYHWALHILEVAVADATALVRTACCQAWLPASELIRNAGGR